MHVLYNSSKCTIPIILRLKVLHTWVSKKPEKPEKKPEPEFSGRGWVRFQLKFFSGFSCHALEKPESSRQGGFQIFSGFCTLYYAGYFYWDQTTLCYLIKPKTNKWLLLIYAIRTLNVSWKYLTHRLLTYKSNDKRLWYFLFLYPVDLI